VFTEPLPLSLLPTKNLLPLQKLSWFGKTGFHHCEKDFISGEIPTTVIATMEVDGSNPSRGGIDPSHKKDDTSSKRGGNDPSNSMHVAWTSRGGVTTSIHFWLTGSENIDSKGSCTRKGGTMKNAG
jgi:hypothetical protein